jgi:hypothetical protein
MLTEGESQVSDPNEIPEPVEAAPEPLDQTTPSVDEHQSEDRGPGFVGQVDESDE